MTIDLPGGRWLSGGKIFGTCEMCEKVVRLDKPLIGSMHLCLEQEERQV